MKPVMTEAQLEAVADAAVMRRLEWDHAYRDAENAEQQAEREQQITDEVVANLEHRYEIR
jgi:FixJ family two-component response regulator